MEMTQGHKALLEERWKHITDKLDIKRYPEDVERDHRFFGMLQIIENQDKEFAVLADSEGGQRVLKALKDGLGGDFRDIIYFALLRAGLKSPIWDLVGVQVMQGPIGVLNYYSRPQITAHPDSETSELCTECRIDLVTEEARARPSRMRVRFSGTSLRDLAQLYGESVCDDATYVYFDETFLELTRRCLSDLLTVAETTSVETVSKSELCEGLNRQSTLIHKRTMRGPANIVVGEPETLSLVGDGERKRYRLHEDQFFPKGKLLLYRLGKNFLDVPYIFAPYVFQFGSTFVEKEGEETTAHRMGLRIRYDKKMVHEDAVALVVVE